MNTTEDVQNELESCLKGINSAGLASFDSHNMEKLERISAATAAQGMSQGKKLVDNLIAALNSVKEDKSTIDSVSIRLTALDFYLQNTKGSTEEL